MADVTLYIDIEELCENESIDEEIIIEVVEYGIAVPHRGETLAEWIFDLENAYWIKKAVKLNQQLLLDWVAISMVIDLMKDKEKLVQENDQLRSRLNRLIE